VTVVVSLHSGSLWYARARLTPYATALCFAGLVLLASGMGSLAEDRHRDGPGVVRITAQARLAASRAADEPRPVVQRTAGIVVINVRKLEVGTLKASAFADWESEEGAPGNDPH
jgi:hypothetical protein